jgi:hypothetical protein
LKWDSQHQRDGTDAIFTVDVGDKKVSIDVEVKSTTGESVSTARDVGMAHIQKWRSRFWIIGFYTKSRDPDLIKTLCLTPADIEPWVAGIEQKILPDFSLANHAAQRLTLEDLFAICGKKDFYTIEDAKRLYKQQWSAEEYRNALDMVFQGKKVISQAGMLSVLRLRSTYISQRGATLNNPHVTTTFLRGFEKTNRAISDDWAIKLREIAKEYLMGTPNHPFEILEK